MATLGYAVIDVATGNVLQSTDTLPLMFLGEMSVNIGTEEAPDYVMRVAQVNFDKAGLVAPDSLNPLWKCVEMQGDLPPSSEHVVTGEEHVYHVDNEIVVVHRTFSLPATTTEQVNAERDRRAALPFTFNNQQFQARVEDQKRINGAVTLALIAISAGAQPGDLRWHGGTEDFVWIADDNSLVTMDAFTMIEFGKAAAFHEAGHVFAARAIKNMEPIPTNYKDNLYWP